VSAVQKSGTNSFHGAAYEFNRNTDFNASDFFTNRAGSSKPEYIRNQFGGEVDGPIIRNKTFFTGAFDRTDIHQGSTLVVQVPTSSELAAMTLGAGPNAQAYIKKFSPLTSDALCPAEAVNEPDAVGHIGCIVLSDPILTGQNVYVARIDQNFSANDRLSFTANISRYNNTDKYGGGHPTTAVNIPLIDDEHYHNLSLIETHVFNASLVNELTIAHNRHFSDTSQRSAVLERRGSEIHFNPRLLELCAHYHFVARTPRHCRRFAPWPTSSPSSRNFWLSPCPKTT
jgi:hypothetical protein